MDRWSVPGTGPDPSRATRLPLFSLFLTSMAIQGCAGAAVGVATAGASEAATGKTITDHALSTVAGKDCNLIEGAARDDRDVCEPKQSKAADRDFKGFGQARR